VFSATKNVIDFRKLTAVRVWKNNTALIVQSPMQGFKRAKFHFAGVI
jgi:hypothetical protein